MRLWPFVCYYLCFYTPLRRWWRLYMLSLPYAGIEAHRRGEL
jgi:hypothetical protein